VRRFVLIGQTASAHGDFSLDDLPGSSGRLDVLLRAVRAALLVSHGLRRDVQVYLVLRGGVNGARTLRVDGRSVKFLRPDERSLAILIKKTLAATPPATDDFVEVRPGIFAHHGDIGELLPQTNGAPCFVLHEEGADIRAHGAVAEDAWYFIGDHLGFDVVTLALLDRHGCARISVGPVSLHTDDVVALVGNELDRRFSPVVA